MSSFTMYHRSIGDLPLLVLIRLIGYVSISHHNKKKACFEHTEVDESRVVMYILFILLSPGCRSIVVRMFNAII
ncbi:MAG: hypothetical protein J3R72DRAFT_140067 [Linnemannia gamsii]|nr:MAG: hypothetical protein J3R72DRAFT_140067 [Linnemannia gamsii]